MIKKGKRALRTMTVEEFKQYFRKHKLNDLEFINLREYSGGLVVSWEIKWKDEDSRLNLEDGYSYSEFAIAIEDRSKMNLHEVSELMDKGFLKYEK